MKKFILKFIILSDDKIYTNRLGTALHGVLMEILPENYAQFLHEQSINPYSMNVKRQDQYYVWEINALDELTQETFEEVFLSSDFSAFSLKTFNNSSCVIIDKSTQMLTKHDLATIFYQKNPPRQLHLNFETPTAFRQSNRYVFVPDIRLIFQSLNNKYSTIMDQTSDESSLLLEEIQNHIYIRNYNVRSRVIHLHGHTIPGFVGNVVFNLRGNQTLNGYIHMLASFGEYAGVGIKSSIGMGSIAIRQREGE